MKSLIIVSLFAGAFAPTGPVAAAPLAVAQERPAPPAKAAAGLVNLNTADASALESLPGIGPATAKRILEYREKNGPFKKLEDIMNVKGIGEKAFLRLRPQLTIGGPASPAPTQP